MAPDETDRLFVVLPAAFVAARKVLASTLKAAGRREEAAVIEKRPRPSVSTWATNQVARSEPDLIRELGEVTARLQAAGGPDYAQAIAQHRAVLKTLRAKAEEALSAAGLRAALPALAQVLQNLRVGMASPETKRLVETGRLVQDLATAEEASLFESAASALAPRTDDRRPASAPAVADKSNEQDRARAAREAERLRDQERERREQRATLQREMMRLRSSVEVAEAACTSAEAARAAADVAHEKAGQALTAARAAAVAAEARLSAARATLELKSSELSRAAASLAALD